VEYLIARGDFSPQPQIVIWSGSSVLTPDKPALRLDASLVPETWRDSFIDSTGVMSQVPGDVIQDSSHRFRFADSLQKPSEVFQRFLPHRGFDVLSRIRNSRRE
jgi:hypothetical protein